MESKEIKHRLSEEQLVKLFPHGYQQLGDETYLDLFWNFCSGTVSGESASMIKGSFGRS